MKLTRVQREVDDVSEFLRLLSVAGIRLTFYTNSLQVQASNKSINSSNSLERKRGLEIPKVLLNFEQYGVPLRPHQ